MILRSPISGERSGDVEERDRTCIRVRHLEVSGSVGSTQIKPVKSETSTGSRSWSRGITGHMQEELT
jgi:hypothetical protein